METRIARICIDVIVKHGISAFLNIIGEWKQECPGELSFDAVERLKYLAQHLDEIHPPQSSKDYCPCQPIKKVSTDENC